MAHLSGWPLTLVLLGLSLLLLLVFLREVNAYWRKLGVPYVEPRLLFGNAAGLFFRRESFAALIENVYRRLEGCPVGGFYLMTRPYLMLRDPEVIKKVNLWDERYFHASSAQVRYCGFRPASHEVLRDTAVHTEVRRRIGLVFGPERTRRVFWLLEGCVSCVLQHLQAACRDAPGPVELSPHRVFAGYATDVIGRCAFGVECGAIDDPSSQFLRIGMEVSQPTRWDPLLPFLSPLLRPLRYLLPRCTIVSEGHQLFQRLFRETVEHRERHGIQCDDVIQLLLQIKNGGLVTPCSSPALPDATVDEALAYKLFGLFLVGFEMTSSVLSFCAFELAADQAVQTRARLEVDAALRRHSGRLSYDALQRMPYLDAVITETLRLYPPMGVACRQVAAPYEVPGVAAARLRPGDCVCVSVAQLQRDAAHFPQPLAFRPERFLCCRQQAAAHQSGGSCGGGNDGCYLALGWGARPCVGKHFALVEMKAVLAALLSRFELYPSLRSGRRPANPEGAGRDLWVRVTPRIWYSDD
ncbi:cytochrome P450 6a2-like [Schistocerca gregaria]|uniref:cytochrome P450 6a2-like n=1 Tax=Schistocerca gregaria TaxID=7010 RepID=UPI00211E23C6|nr:cytochrome P450 6a2-like [Schistocerca gregaria]